MNPITTFQYISSYSGMPFPTPFEFALGSVTWIFPLCRGVSRGYNRIILHTNPQVDWKGLLIGDLANVIIDRSESAQKIVQMLAVCINIQDLVEAHLKLTQSYQNFWNVCLNKHPPCKKKCWNEFSSKGIVKDYTEAFNYKLKKIIDCIVDLCKRLFLLADCYITNYDVLNSDDLARYNAVNKICLDPKKPFKDFIKNEKRLANLLEDHKDFMNPILKSSGFGDVNLFKNKVNEIVKFQEETVKVVNNTFQSSVTVFKLLKNDDLMGSLNNPEFNKDYEKLGLITQNKRLEKRVPYWIGQPMAPKPIIITPTKSTLLDKENFITPPPEKKPPEESPWDKFRNGFINLAVITNDVAKKLVFGE